METSIGIAEARESFSEIANRAVYRGERFLVERRGKPLVAVISAAEYREIVRLLSESGVNHKIHGIPVRIRYDGERYFISDDIVDLYGVGATLEEARQDYWAALQDCYADLSANANKLAAPLEAHLAYLQGLFAAQKDAV
jgi:prevent-host-death family protein